MRERKTFLFQLIYLYLLLPFLIFLFGWVRWYIALPMAAVILVCAFRMMRRSPSLWVPELNRENLEKLIFITLIILLWVYLSGIGGFVYQNDDHIWRNAMFNVLVSEKWPVISTVELNGETATRGFTYYIGFWLPAAVVGKIFGLQAGYYFQAIWAALGILLFYYCICAVLKKISVWPLLVFIFFSGMDILGCYVLGMDLSALMPAAHLEWWTCFQFSSFTTQLFWVFNQALPAWLITMVLYLQKNNKYCIFLLALSMLCSTLPFVGLIPFAAYWMLSRKYEAAAEQRMCLKVWSKDTFTFENIVGGGLIGIISFLYLTGNVQGNGISFIHLNQGTRLLYLLFILLEMGIYWLFAYYYYKKEVLLYLILCWLCFCPLFDLGGDGNFCMRASIPALLLLYLYVIKVLRSSYRKKHYLVLGLLVVTLAAGAITPLHEIVRTISETNNRYLTGEQITAEPVRLEDVLTNRHESADVQDSIFFQYLAKNR